MPADIGEILAREIGTKHVLRPGAERLEDYGRDESHLGYFPPDCAVLCGTGDEVRAVLKLAKEHKVRWRSIVRMASADTAWCA